jgi:hypothetical protein
VPEELLDATTAPAALPMPRVYGRHSTAVNGTALAAAVRSAVDPLAALQVAVDELEGAYISHCGLLYTSLMHRFVVLSRQLRDDDGDSGEAASVEERLQKVKSNNEMLRKRLLRAGLVRAPSDDQPHATGAV